MDPVRELTNAFPGRRLQPRRTKDGWIMHAPHREDKKPSFSVFRGREGNWMVYDFADSISMPLTKYLKDFAGVELERAERPSKAPATPEPVVDHRADAQALLFRLSGKNKPYLGHGLHHFGGHPDVMTVRGKAGKLKEGDTVMVYRSPEGEPWGVQVRRGSGLKRMYWWASSPEVGIGYSQGWRDSDMLVIAEGLPKAIALAKTLEQQSGKKVGYVAVAGKNNFPRIDVDAIGFDGPVYILADTEIAFALRLDPKSDKVAELIRAMFWKRVAANLETEILQQEDKDINDLLAEVPPVETLKRLIPLKHPPVKEQDIGDFVLPLKGRQALISVVNAYWAYGLMKGKLYPGYVLHSDATAMHIMQLSGLNPQTIKMAKRELREKGILITHNGSQALDIAEMQALFIEPPTHSGTSILLKPSFMLIRGAVKNEVVKITTPPTHDLAAQITYMGGYRRSRWSTYGSTGVTQYLALKLRQLGLSVSQVARLLGVARKTVRDGVARLLRTVSVFNKATNEYWRRFKKEADARLERIGNILLAAADYKAGDKSKEKEWLAYNRYLQRRKRLWYNTDGKPHLDSAGIGLRR